MEQFDEGGQDLGYSDLTVGNSGGEFRTMWDVDIESCVDTGRATTSAGSAQVSGCSTASMWRPRAPTRSSSASPRPAAGGTFRLEVNGVDKTGVMTIPSTGDWQTWTTISKTGVTLSAGPQVFKLVMLTNSPNTNGVGNFNWIKIQ